MPSLHPCLALPLACLLAAQEPAPKPGTATAPSVQFAWPVPSEAIVTETILKQGRTAVTRYRIRLTQDTQPDELRLQLDQFEFVSMEGLDLKDPQVQQRLAGSLAMASAIPDLIVGKDGAFLRIEGIDAMVDRLAADIAKTKSKAEADQFSRMLKSPQMAPMLAQAAATFWDCWVGDWRRTALGSGQQATDDTELPLATSKLRTKRTVQHHGNAAEPGLVRLSQRHAIADEGQRRSLVDFVVELSRSARQELPRDQIESVELVMHSDVVTEAATLRPRTASYEKGVELATKGQPKRRQVERHGYEFAWQPAAGPR